MARPAKAKGSAPQPKPAPAGAPASMPARSNKGGAVRGQARAAQVKVMNAAKRKK